MRTTKWSLSFGITAVLLVSRCSALGSQSPPPTGVATAPVESLAQLGPSPTSSPARVLESAQPTRVANATPGPAGGLSEDEAIAAAEEFVGPGSTESDAETGTLEEVASLLHTPGEWTLANDGLDLNQMVW